MQLRTAGSPLHGSLMRLGRPYSSGIKWLGVLLYVCARSPTHRSKGRSTKKRLMMAGDIRGPQILLEDAVFSYC